MREKNIDEENFRKKKDQTEREIQEFIVKLMRCYTATYDMGIDLNKKRKLLKSIKEGIELLERLDNM